MSAAFAIIFTLLSTKSYSRCFESIVSFGDSLTDTGNGPLLHPANETWLPSRPPYGRTYFHHPTGRCSDGRIIVDFIAQSLGLPFVPPYVAGEKDGRNFSSGVNFAVASATALVSEFYEKKGIHNPGTNVSLGVQWNWFKQFLASIPDGRNFLQKTLVVMGEIGANDYNHLIGMGRSTEELQSLAPSVIKYISSKIEELVENGVKTMLVPGIPPLGCLPLYLTEFKNSSTAKDYDKQTGCLSWLNNITMHHNQLLQKELNRLRIRHPKVGIIYADYYNAMSRIFISPDEFGFRKQGIHRACCGAGAPYNWNKTAPCGISPATSCEDPSSFVGWEGMHFTEAAYRVVAQGLLEGPYTIPQMKTICPPVSMASLQEKLNLFTKILAMATILLLNVSMF